MQPQTQSLLQFLYRISLEPIGRWCMFIGPGLEEKPPYLDIGVLSGFVQGFREGLDASGRLREDAFFTWLRDEAGAFPGDGWNREFLRRANGRHDEAVRLFFEQLHRYLLERRPEWFVRFNSTPQPSQVVDGAGDPTSRDLRLGEHVKAVSSPFP